MTDPSANRRPLKSRSTRWARALAGALLRARATPDHISLLSILFAMAGAGLLLYSPTPAGLVAVAACIQLRLLCNLLDGMVAVEGGRGSPVGALYNEIPDRIADSLFLVPLGYACGVPALGWYGALAAAVTAYIRVLGGTLGNPQDFRGPLAKQQRMAVMTVGCLVAAAELAGWGTARALEVTAWIIALGATLTCITRTRAIARNLRAG